VKYQKHQLRIEILRTWNGDDGGVEERNGGINKERVTGDKRSNDPIGYLEKASSSNNPK